MDLQPPTSNGKQEAKKFPMKPALVRPNIRRLTEHARVALERRTRVAILQQILDSRISNEDVEQIIDNIRASALEGYLPACREVLNRMIGCPPRHEPLQHNAGTYIDVQVGEDRQLDGGSNAT